MQVGAARETTPENSSVDGKRSVRGGSRFSFRNSLAVPGLIFAFAFFLRYLYNAVFMEHRIAHFGDAYNFLRSGSCLLEAIVTSHTPMDFFSKIYHATAPQAQLLQSMTSMNLTDRLMIDGPVYPGYLALIEYLSGVNALKPIFDSHTVQLSLCNSFVDALACVLVYVCGRLAFNRQSATVAALLFAIYPAAIINTQHCYSEPFTYFLLNAWTALVLVVLLRHSPRPRLQAAAWCGLGMFSGLIMLSKPAFILLPPMVALALLPVSIIKALQFHKSFQSKCSGLQSASYENSDGHAKSGHAKSGHVDSDGHAKSGHASGHVDSDGHAKSGHVTTDELSTNSDSSAAVSSAPGSAGFQPASAPTPPINPGSEIPKTHNSAPAPTPLSPQQTLQHLALRYLKHTTLAAIGAIIILTPWVFFNKAVSGQYSVFVNRVPSFNIFHGNQIATDAWRCYPFYGCFPGDSKLVIASLIADARVQPILFIGLQFKKIARLWSGVWNEYHYSLFGIPLELQSLFHQILLLLGVLGLSYLLFRSAHKTQSRSFNAALVLGTIVLFHFAYIPFEAISRYAITAMPAVVLLASAILVNSWNKSETRRSLATLLILSAVSLSVVSQSGYFANLFASLLPPSGLSIAGYLTVAVSCLALFACLALGAELLNRLAKDSGDASHNNRFQLAIPALVTLLSAIVAGIYIVQSHDWKEWRCSVNSHQSIEQIVSISTQIPNSVNAADSNSPNNATSTPTTSVANSKAVNTDDSNSSNAADSTSTILPKSYTNGTAFVLVDLNAETLSPPMKVQLNGHVLAEAPVPLAQFQPNNADILQCLAIQGEGMGLDLRTFRNWWVVPFPVAQLQKGPNKIEVSCSDDKAKLMVYGDFSENSSSGTADGATFLPSLRSFSYTKGFTTFDHRDPRVFEKQDVEGTTSGSRLVQSGKSSANSDLSDSPGAQYGRYRIRILVPTWNSQSKLQTQPNIANTQLSDAKTRLPSFINTPITLVSADHPQLVQGQDPASFVPKGKETIQVSPGLPMGTRFTFSSQFRSVSAKRPYFVVVSFSGKDAKNEPHSWSSKWQPIAIQPSRDFRTTSFTDAIPDEILALKDLRLNIMFSPFQPDFLFLKPKQAVKNSVEVRDATLVFLPPLSLPPLDSRAWKLY